MRRCTLPSPAILLLLAMVGLLLAAGSAQAQFDRAEMSKPVIDVNGTGNTPHGGGDPDNPVPVLESGQMMMGAEEIEHHEEIYGLPADRRVFGALVPYARVIRTAIGSILLF